MVGNLIREAYEISSEFSVEDLNMMVQKELDKSLIKLFWVPAKKGEIKKIIKEFDSEAKKVATETKTNLAAVGSQLDSQMKGKFSQSVQTKLSSENKKWDKL